MMPADGTALPLKPNEQGLRHVRLAARMTRKAIAFLVRRQCEARLSLTLSAAAFKIRRPQSAITTLMSAMGRVSRAPSEYDGAQLYER